MIYVEVASSEVTNMYLVRDNYKLMNLYDYRL